MEGNINFSNVNRKETLQNIAKDSYDLIVIGGGITGAGIALDASSRGMKVLLLEKGDFASGTSSKSTKLIHGGLRYLKQFDFWLVKEVGSERAIVHKLAPHLVLPEKMLLPLIEGGSYGKWLTSIGLKVYDILAQVTGDDKRQMLEKKEAMKLEPLLPKKILNGAGYYAEYRTDDARLTMENVKTSLQFGTHAFNYTKVTDFVYENERVAGVKFSDEVFGDAYEVSSKYVINAAGPWVDELRSVNHSKKGKRLHLTKGVHLVFPKEKLPVKQSVYFDIPDGRMMFAIPRGKITYIGTTDTNYNLDKDQVTTDIADAIYLVSAVNHMFPDINLELDDIISSWAGLRPLIHEEGKSASELSRKDEIFTSDTGLVSIAGGKLTGYRKMAERVVNRIAKEMEEDFDLKLKPCSTDKIPLCGNGFKKFKHVKKYIAEVLERIEKDGFKKYDAWYLVTTYGKQTETILELYSKIEGDSPKERMIRAEAQFAIAYEMAVIPLDFFIRRTGRLYFDIESVRNYMQVVFEEFQQAYSYSDTEMEVFNEKLEAELEEHSNFSLDRA
ncbi:glycerol-3-phosphate dehydrogenase/oxidase [Flagellimonas zhangzhouensis]|uniref:Glycerol-3-phosphate dehydrogenase n=1 Tax=Flagellimonas zhangzhouensis TaxID=1073328 RepID=A0A1H2V5M6_9FLAO|nr:glycerol-3-phosphate dehydrogenase/oxidase [Allomuricauda zhangzhouensis]SDQ10919.1 homodimeric glycerol 3-phosphate dehydrogenase (quinone) [Allomuricauda zhangzhouensis]SDW63234.1 homodimeric glycerol 3-phosphate dehydrogenase (quinone) [Allomuricauda zhangzhouensis]